MSPDFSPLEVAQRYTGAISDDRCTIDGSWEHSTEDSGWEHDFSLTYAKV